MKTQQIPEEIFRENDIRGLAETELTAEFVQTLGRACGVLFHKKGEHRVIVGRDNRLSSERIFKDLTRGLLAAGCEVIEIGLVTTPIFYFSLNYWEINAGVMITASHNPKEYNGFKIALGPGTIFGEDIQELRLLCETLDEAQEELISQQSMISINPTHAYLDMLCDKIALGNRRLSVAIDCGNGTAGPYAVDLFQRLGCDVHPIYCESDGCFPHHHPDPVKAANLFDLATLLRKEGSDLGVAFDGDGDRLGVLDEEGRILRGDRLMVLFWREILDRNPGADCIIEVKCSKALVEEVERLGGKPCYYKTGHSLVKAKMRELGALFAGEMSGHMFFADEYFGFDDAFYAAARLLRILSNSSQKLSELLAEVPNYPSTAETYVQCSDRDKFRIVGELTERFRHQYPIIDVDGVRVILPEGWALARASNTQPAIVTRCEGLNDQALQEICRMMKAALMSFPEVEEFSWER